MKSNQNRINRERRTLKVMVEIYCRGHHHSQDDLCTQCQGLMTYALQRIDRCPIQANKSSCARCSSHCYKPDRREQVRGVMRYAGPRMIIYHPVLAILHFWDELTKPSLPPSAR